jgi:signal transduction histidine kinase
VFLDAGIEGAWLRLSVSNTGTGIPKDQHEAVFGRFERDTARQMGTGLGLYLCQRIVKAHAGSIAIDDSSDWATRISVRLPRRVHGIVNAN